MTRRIPERAVGSGRASSYAARMPSTQTVADGRVVTLHYKLSLGDEIVVDTHAEEAPMSYLHGAENIVRGLEVALTGKKAGDLVDVVVEAKDAYGERDEDAIDEVPRDVFPDDIELEVGLQLTAEDEDGEVIPCVVREIHADHVVVDMNHPLAGERLRYQVQLLEVREATAEELEHGHPAGEDCEHD